MLFPPSGYISPLHPKSRKISGWLRSGIFPILCKLFGFIKEDVPLVLPLGDAPGLSYFLFCHMTLWIYYARMCNVNRMPELWWFTTALGLDLFLQFDSCCFILIFNDFPVSLMYSYLEKIPKIINNPKLTILYLKIILLTILISR